MLKQPIITLPTPLERIVSSYLDTAQQLQLILAERQISPHSIEAVQLLIEFFGGRYDSDTTILEDLEEYPWGSIPTKEQVYIWCRCPAATSELILMHDLENVVVVMSDPTQKRILRPFIDDNYYLRTITYLMPWVEIIWNDWMTSCRELVSVDLKGMCNLQTVGSNWMYACPRLVDITYTGVSQLSRVRNGWMEQCPSLQSVDLSPLTSLVEVGTSVDRS
jgi:hypothetical protein